MLKQEDLVGRLENIIGRLAEFNGAPQLGGVTREVFTPEYTAATEYVTTLMRDAGLEVSTDAFGNLFGRWEAGDGGAPTLLSGSHFDTTLNAGKYDGVVGVVGAIEALRLLKEEGFRPRRPLAVVAFAGEEPRFGAGCIGSRAMMGDLSRENLDEMRDRGGISLAEALSRAGFDPERLGEARLDAADVHAFVELHVEQGAVLEEAGMPVGVVEKIAAPHDLRLEIKGAAMHSGSTPMRMRRDALVGASEVVAGLERLTNESPSETLVGTVGVLRVEPGAVNVIPGTVVMEADIRDSDLEARETVVDGFLELAREVCGRRGLDLDVEEITADTPRECDGRVVSAAEEACRELGVTYLPMISGAYHDAMVLGKGIPMGMIFVPSAGGISHSPEEFTAMEDVARGVRVLSRTLARLAS